MSYDFSGIRIARISTVPFFIITQLKSQIEFLVASNAKVTVIASKDRTMSNLDAIEGIIYKPIDISRSITPWRDINALIRLFLLFKKERIQIVHSTTPKAGLLTALAAFFAGVPIRLHTFTGQPWIDMKGLIGWIARKSDSLISYLNTRCYADSKSQRHFLIEKGVVDSEKIFVIGEGSLAGVDLQRFDQNKFTDKERDLLKLSLGIPLNSLVLLFVGRITIDKGVRELLRASAILEKKGYQAHLVFVGPFDVDSGVIGAISQQDIEKVSNTHIVGYCENPEKYMAIADILCLPSYREGFGTVVIEAAAMGLPTVGTDIYGLSDAIVNNETGLLVPPKDVEQLAEALTALLESEKLRTTMGLAAKYRAETLFDAKEVNKQLIAEYCNLLQIKQMLK